MNIKYTLGAILASADPTPEPSDKIMGLSKSVFIAIVIAVIIIFLLIVYLSYFLQSIGKNEVAIIERNGRFKKAKREGLVCLIPFADVIVARIDVSNGVLNTREPITLIDSNNTSFKVKLSTTYEIVDVEKYYYSCKNPIELLEVKIGQALSKYFATIKVSSSSELVNYDSTLFINKINETTEKEVGIKVSDLFFKEIE